MNLSKYVTISLLTIFSVLSMSDNLGASGGVELLEVRSPHKSRHRAAVLRKDFIALDTETFDVPGNRCLVYDITIFRCNNKVREKVYSYTFDKSNSRLYVQQLATQWPAIHKLVHEANIIAFNSSFDREALLNTKSYMHQKGFHLFGPYSDVCFNEIDARGYFRRDLKRKQGMDIASPQKRKISGSRVELEERDDRLKRARKAKVAKQTRKETIEMLYEIYSGGNKENVRRNVLSQINSPNTKSYAKSFMTRQENSQTLRDLNKLYVRCGAEEQEFLVEVDDQYSGDDRVKALANKYLEDVEKEKKKQGTSLDSAVKAAGIDTFEEACKILDIDWVSWCHNNQVDPSSGRHTAAYDTILLLAYLQKCYENYSFGVPYDQRDGTTFRKALNFQDF